MMSYQVQQTFTSGAKVRHLPALVVLEEDPWNTSLAAAQKPLEMGAIAVAESVATAINTN